MNIKDYQNEARKTAIYPSTARVLYPALGLAGETGEVCEKIKKQIRDKAGNFADAEFINAIEKELGDVLWYLANLSKDLGIDLNVVAVSNLAKLKMRQSTGKLRGSGDDR